MENKEIKRTLPETHDCNLGNKVVNEIIKNPIYIPPNDVYSRDENGRLNCYEWIPWERLSNINEIDRGGFSIIYKATVIDVLIDKWSIKHHGSTEYKTERTEEVAIKIIPTNSEELFKELNIQRAIAIHQRGPLSYISSIWGITQNVETLEYGVVMDFAKHGNMRNYLSKNFHSTSWDGKLRIAWNIASGLSQIHSSGMVHSNLNVFKILQFSQTRIQIGGLGLCQPVNQEETTTTTTTTEEKKIYGVIPYIPPEVLRGEKFTTAGDIYSFSMLLWELATGKPPFHDYPHDHILIMAILNGQRPKITFPLIPPSIAKLIEKCWDPNPKNRPTAREVVDKLAENTYPNSEFRVSDKYVRESLKNDSTQIIQQ
ncbi:hypothetical protein G9A89_023971 [Geosiphon pyriformis]|nr:hypothetical protein G9A89_023971 [Geosiphon pyriformis]